MGPGVSELRTDMRDDQLEAHLVALTEAVTFLAARIETLEKRMLDVLALLLKRS
jgi:hypothetical protein